MFEDLYDMATDGAPDAEGPPDILLRLHVQPGAGRNAVMGRHGDALKLKVGAPPEGGRANAAVVALVAASLGIREAQVTLESGASSRAKRVRITGVDTDDVGRLLDLAITAGSGGGNGGARRGVARHAS